MIEAKQAGEGQEYNVFDGETLLCTVATIRRVYGTYLQPIANQTAHNSSNDVEKSASTEAAKDKV